MAIEHAYEISGYDKLKPKQQIIFTLKLYKYLYVISAEDIKNMDIINVKRTRRGRYKVLFKNAEGTEYEETL